MQQKLANANKDGRVTLCVIHILYKIVSSLVDWVWDYVLLLFFISQEKHCHTVDSTTECEGNPGKDNYGIGQGEEEGGLQTEKVTPTNQIEIFQWCSHCSHNRQSLPSDKGKMSSAM